MQMNSGTTGYTLANGGGVHSHNHEDGHGFSHDEHKDHESSGSKKARHGPSSSPPLPPPLPPSHFAVRVSTATINAARSTLRSARDLIESALDNLVSPACPACKCEFMSTSPSAEESHKVDRTPRMFRCGHSVCTECIREEAIKHKTAIKCSTCSYSETITLPTSAASASSSPASSSSLSLPRLLHQLDVDHKLPLNHDLIALLRTFANFNSAIPQFNTNTQRLCAAAQSCITAMSSSNLFATPSTHPSSSTSSSSSSSAASSSSSSSSLSAAAASSSFSDRSFDDTDLLELEIALHDQKEAQRQLLSKKRHAQRLRSEENQRDEEELHEKALRELRRKKKEEKRARLASASNSNATLVTPTAATSDRSRDRTSSDPSSATSVVHSHRWSTDMSVSPICVHITTHQRSRLQAWLGDIPLSRSRLLYRGTRDGWQASDFFRRVSNVGPTLTLVRVANCGFIFGAFTAIPWLQPEHVASQANQNNGGSGSGSVVTVSGKLFSNVFDRSYRSFLFSLQNRHNFPFRMTLTQTRGPAVILHPTLGPMFGGKAKGPDGKNCQWPNLSLFWNDRPGHAHESNIANDPIISKCSYQIEYERDYPPPEGFTCNQDTFGKNQLFAMEEIECYSI